MNLAEIETISIELSDNLIAEEKKPFINRLAFKVKQLFFKYLPSRLSPEQQLKTTVTLLLVQEKVRRYFLGDTERRDEFIRALNVAAQELGCERFKLTEERDINAIAKELTRLDGESLIGNRERLASLSSALDPQAQRAILCTILEQVARPQVNSKVKGKSGQIVSLTTEYAKYKVTLFEPNSGKINYSCQPNYATTSIRTAKNGLRGQKGAINQHRVWGEQGRWIGSYCGELTTPHYLLEQIFFILGHSDGKAVRLANPPEGAAIEELKILFTSLFSWREFSLISDQREAIRQWDQQLLFSQGRYFKLNLLHYNIPFSHAPIPGETKAAMQDMNGEATILLTAAFFKQLGIENRFLTEIAGRIDSLRSLKESHFLEREKALLEEIDAFRKLIPDLLTDLDRGQPSPFVHAAKALIQNRVQGIERLLCLEYAARTSGYFHNKNSRNGMDRAAAADAADKSQYAFELFEKRPYLPGLGSENDTQLFKKLYSLYLLKEEPEINAAFSTGFRKKIHKNLEVRHYLT